VPAAAIVELNDATRALVKARHDQGDAPRQIARALGLPPSLVLAELRAMVDAEYNDPDARAVVGCWATNRWSSGLVLPAEYRGMDVDTSGFSGSEGLIGVSVARRAPGNQLRLCHYLVDTFCLGVKNTIGPLRSTAVDLEPTLEQLFSSHPGGYQEIPHALAADLVYGAVEYARSLGFEPARGSDYRDTADHLGPWTGPSPIVFGKNGRPFFINGPNDEAGRIIATLEQSVGHGNYDMVIGFGG
jgi:hypothetical protein